MNLRQERVVPFFLGLVECVGQRLLIFKPGLREQRKSESSNTPPALAPDHHSRNDAARETPATPGPRRKPCFEHFALAYYEEVYILLDR